MIIIEIIPKKGFWKLFLKTCTNITVLMLKRERDSLQYIRNKIKYFWLFFQYSFSANKCPNKSYFYSKFRSNVVSSL